MPITATTKTIEEQVLGVLAIAQEAVVDGVHRVAEAVEPVIPDVPRPFASETAELVNEAFSFAEKLLHSSHQFVGRLLEATDNIGVTKSAPTTPKPAAATKAGAK